MKLKPQITGEALSGREALIGNLEVQVLPFSLQVCAGGPLGFHMQQPQMGGVKEATSSSHLTLPLSCTGLRKMASVRMQMPNTKMRIKTCTYIWKNLSGSFPLWQFMIKEHRVPLQAHSASCRSPHGTTSRTLKWTVMCVRGLALVRGRAWFSVGSSGGCFLSKTKAPVLCTGSPGV